MYNRRTTVRRLESLKKTDTLIDTLHNQIEKLSKRIEKTSSKIEADFLLDNEKLKDIAIASARSIYGCRSSVGYNEVKLEVRDGKVTAILRWVNWLDPDADPSRRETQLKNVFALKAAEAFSIPAEYFDIYIAVW